MSAPQSPSHPQRAPSRRIGANGTTVPGYEQHHRFPGQLQKDYSTLLTELGSASDLTDAERRAEGIGVVRKFNPESLADAGQYLPTNAAGEIAQHSGSHAALTQVFRAPLNDIWTDLDAVVNNPASHPLRTGPNFSFRTDSWRHGRLA